MNRKGWANHGWFWVAWVGLALHFAAAEALMAGAKPFWLDEFLTYFQVSGKTLSQSLAALHSPLNLMPYGYVALTHGIVEGLSLDLQAIRWLSALGLIATFPFLVGIAGRVCRPGVALAASFLVLALSRNAFTLACEARPYGLVVLSVAAITWLVLRCSTSEGQPALGSFALITAATLAALSVHYVSVAPICLVLVAGLFASSGARRRQSLLCLSVGGGLFVFAAIHLHLMHDQKGTGLSWIPPAKLASAAQTYAGEFRPVFSFLILAVALVGAAHLRTVLGRVNRQWATHRFLAIWSLGLLCAPLAFLCLSMLGHHYYVNRYFGYYFLGWTPLVALGIERVLQRSSPPDRAWLPGMTAVVLLLLAASSSTARVRFFRAEAPSRAGYEQAAQEALKLKVPVVFAERDAWIAFSYLNPEVPAVVHNPGFSQEAKLIRTTGRRAEAQESLPAGLFIAWRQKPSSGAMPATPRAQKTIWQDDRVQVVLVQP